MKRLLRVICLLSLILSPLLSKATLPVNITASNTSGCDSLFAYFTPTVTGCSSGITYVWHYTAPGGSPVYHTSLANRTFNLPGTWTVSCTAYGCSDSGNSNTINVTITAGPTIDFTTSTPGSDTVLVCGPRTINFINTSSVSSCTGSRWQWIISGPTSMSSTARDTSYTFTAPGLYTVTLLYFAPACGCFGSVVKTNYIKIDNFPTACFTRSDSVICHPPGSISFDASCSIGAASYAWTFGDGGTGSAVTETHNYTTTGYKNVRLIVTSAGGCVDTMKLDSAVYVSNLSVTMTRSTTDTAVCEGSSITFTGTASDAAANHYMTVYDGVIGGTVVTSNAGTPSAFTFATPGYYVVQDVVTDGGGCTAATSMGILVRPNPIIDSITADTLYRCTPPLITHFVPHTTPSSGLTYLWSFAGSTTTTSSAATPTVTYTATGSFSPGLTVTDGYGCSATTSRGNYIVLRPTHVSFTKSFDSGCVGLSVDFTVDVDVPIAGTSYTMPFHLDTMYFGDGTGPGSFGTGDSCRACSHTYSTPGLHYVKVVYTLIGHGGCTFSYIDSVKIGASHPDFHPTVSPSDTVCPNTTVAFHANCTNCTFYEWSFQTPSGTLYTLSGPPSTTGSSADTTSVFYSEVLSGAPPGRYPWNLIMSFNGCTDTLDSVTVVHGPRKGTITPVFDCHKRAGIRDSVTLVLSGVSTVISTTPPLNYDSVNYWYDSTASGGRVLIATLTYTATATAPQILGGHFSPGWHYITVVERGPSRRGGCTVTTTVSFFVGATNLVTKVSDTVICLGSPISITGPHILSDSTAYETYKWHYGDHTYNPFTDDHNSSASATDIDSIVTYTYTATGTYYPYVVVVDQYNCLDTASQDTVRVIGISGGATVTPTRLCVGDSVTFTDNNTSIGYAVGRRWNEVGITTPISYARTFRRAWGAVGTYTIRLHDSDFSPRHCTADQTFTVQTVKPDAYFTSPDSATTVCPFVSVCFHDTNTHCLYSWNFGDGPSWSTPSATARDTCHTYTYASNFNVKCAIYADGTDGIYPAGCSDTCTRNAYIHAASTTVTSSNYGDGDTVSCPPLRIVRYGDSATFSYVWHVYAPGAAGTTFTGALLNTTGYSTGVYTVTCIGTNPRGCTDSVSYRYFIGGPTGYIWLSDTAGCAPDSIRFHFVNTGVSITSNYIWNMCPFGSFSTTGDTTFIFNTAGVYCPPTLTIQSGTCVVNITNFVDSIRIYPVPTVTVAGAGLICYGSATTLIASGADTYTWSPSTFLTSTTSASPSLSPTVTTTYTVRGTTIYGCYDEESVTVSVDPPIHLRISGRDSVCIGLCDTLTASGLPAGTSYEWRGTGTACAVCDVNVICITSTKVFTVSATDAAGCKDSTTFKVTINPAPVLHYTPAEPYVCHDDRDPTIIHMSGAQSYVWKPRIGLSCDSCDAPAVTSPSNIIYSVTGTTKYGCTDSIIIPVITYDSVPVAVFRDTSICNGATVELVAKGGVKYFWTPNYNIDDQNSYRPKVHPNQNTTYKVHITENVCFSKDLFVKVRVVQLPVLQVPPGATIIAGNHYQLYANYGDTANKSYLHTFTWAPADSTLTCTDCPRPIATPYVTTTYTVVASTIEGCEGTATVTVKILCEGSQVFIPNTFTPNGDGVNDHFIVSGKGLGLVTKMAIYNRWGEQIYDGVNLKSNDMGYGWDGTYKGEVLSPDVYVYVIEVECTTGEKFVFRGDISLIR